MLSGRVERPRVRRTSEYRVSDHPSAIAIERASRYAVRPLPGIFLVTAPSSRIARKASFPNRTGRHRARGLCSQGYAMIGGASVLNAASSLYFPYATLAGAFVA
jgi:hypothetical protein